MSVGRETDIRLTEGFFVDLAHWQVLPVQWNSTLHPAADASKRSKRRALEGLLSDSGRQHDREPCLLLGPYRGQPPKGRWKGRCPRSDSPGE